MADQNVRPPPARTTPPRCPPDAFEERDGWRYQATATNTSVGQLAFLEARHPAHARVEDRIRQAQDVGLGRRPLKLFAIKQVWLELALTATNLLAWTQTILLAGEKSIPMWPRPSGRRSVTGSRTPPPGSHAPPAEPACVCRRAGPGHSPLARAFDVLRRISVPAAA
jgi:hypothetical protein